MKKLILLLPLLFLLATQVTYAATQVNVSCTGTWVANGDGTQRCVTDSSTGNNTTPTPSTATSCGTNCNLGYVALEPIPGLTTGNLTDPHNLPDIINAIFKILITGGALFAVLMLTIGGIQYMVSGGPLEKAKGIKRAQAALWGIVLIAASWLILNTINPQLLKFNLDPCAGSPAGGCTVTGTAATSNTAANNTSTNLGVSSTADDLVNKIKNETPTAEICNDARLATGITTPQTQQSFNQIVSASGRAFTTWYYTAKAALYEADITNTNTPITDMYNAGSAAYNKAIAADTDLISRCQSQGF